MSVRVPYEPSRSSPAAGPTSDDIDTLVTEVRMDDRENNRGGTSTRRGAPAAADVAQAPEVVFVEIDGASPEDLATAPLEPSTVGELVRHVADHAGTTSSSPSGVPGSWRASRPSHSHMPASASTVPGAPATSRR
jgi:hypothetical protein